MSDNHRLTGRLRGIVPPLVTPLRDRDELDHDGLERLVPHILDGGVSALFILGTTGEGPALSYRLRYELLERTSELVGGRVPLLICVTDTSLVETLDLCRRAEDEGAAAVVAAPPYYFPMSQAALERYFRKLADESPLPVFLYNMPACTKVAIEPETIERLLDHPNIAGVKDSSGDLNYFQHVLRLRERRPDWSVLVGPEHLLAETVMLGGDGGVNGGANLHPRLFVDLFEAASRREGARVVLLQAQVLSLGRIYAIGDPSVSVTRSLKCGLAALGICTEFMAEPIEPLKAAERDAVLAVLAELAIGVETGQTA